MTGNGHDLGLIQRTLALLFDCLPPAATCSLSYFEVYNETILDLLSHKGDHLDLREDEHSTFSIF